MRRAEVRALYRKFWRGAIYATRGDDTVVKTSLQSIIRNRFHFGTEISEQTAYRTLQLLENAGKYSGIEHDLVKQLCRVHWWWDSQSRHYRIKLGNPQPESPMIMGLNKTMENYNHMIRMLSLTCNIDMGLPIGA